MLLVEPRSEHTPACIPLHHTASLLLDRSSNSFFAACNLCGRLAKALAGRGGRTEMMVKEGEHE
jgi:hypothetical protein